MLQRLKRGLLLRTRWNLFRSRVVVAGLPAAISGVCRGRIVGARKEYKTKPKHVAHPLYVRANSSDFQVYSQIFVGREYACLDNMQDVRLIIDCGANVGYSSAYFLSKHPESHVVAIEPDSGNFQMLQRNLAGYGSRATLIRAGVWSHATQLVISQDKYRDGAEWARQVRECHQGEVAEIEGIDIGTILSRSGYPRISLLKMDIEGAEVVVFSGAQRAWLDKVDAMAIELHDDSSFGSASEVFNSAIRGQGFQLSRSGELTICKRSG